MDGITRRELLKRSAGTALGAAALQVARVTNVGAADTEDSRPPDLVVILTDEERKHTHLPKGFIEQRMPSWGRLAAHGITFENAFIASAMCSPSRAALLTGQYAATNGLPNLEYPTPVLRPAVEVPNIATVLRDVGYDVIWKGKWHLSFPVAFEGGSPATEDWTAQDADNLEQTYDMAGWNPPEAGNVAVDSPAALSTMGGGTANNDGRFTVGVHDPDQTAGLGESVVDYIDRIGGTSAEERAPFCLFVSLVNPHDIAFYPDGWDAGGYELADFGDLPIELPPSATDSLATKPTIQAAFRDAMDEQVPFDSEEDLSNYVRFYAYLHSVVEPHINEILDALDRHGLTEETIVVRTADHGEMGLAHGLREKTYNAYEETIHVPLVISNPRLFPEAETTKAMYSHVDLIATLAELAGAATTGVGVSQVPVLEDPSSSAQDAVVFAFDDSFYLDTSAPGSHIRALRTPRWTYAVYYSADGTGFEFELYDNDADPAQVTNLLFEPAEDILETWLDLHSGLTRKLEAKGATPDGFDWPEDPTTV